MGSNSSTSPVDPVSAPTAELIKDAVLAYLNRYIVSDLILETDSSPSKKG